MCVHDVNYTNLHYQVNTNTYLTERYTFSHTPEMEFKEWLRAQMDARQLTEKQLEEITEKRGEKVPQPSINRILTGNTGDPRINTVAALMRSFGVDIRTLFAPEGLKQVDSIAATEEERVLLFGFRSADASTRRHMLRMAQDSIADFPQRNGIQSH